VEQNPQKGKKKGPTNSRGPGIGGVLVCVVSNGAGLFFCFLVIDIPGIGTARAEGYGRIGVFQGDVVSAATVAVEFEQVGDPIGVVVLFDLEQELDRQLIGFDVAGDGEELTVFAIEGGQDHVVHPEGQLGVVLSGFGRQQFCFFEILVEGGCDQVVTVTGGGADGNGVVGGNWGSEAAAEADCQEQGCYDGDFFAPI